MSLTGRFELRRTWTGKIVLQIEEEVKNRWPGRKAAFRRRWRDATVMDLANPEMRPLIDLRRRPRAVTSSQSLSRPEEIPVGVLPNGHDQDTVVTH
jgi:hypothetical protein